jgi:hypothetical protein
MRNKTAARRAVGRRVKNVCCSLPQSLLLHGESAMQSVGQHASEVRCTSEWELLVTKLVAS